MFLCLTEDYYAIDDRATISLPIGTVTRPPATLYVLSDREHAQPVFAHHSLGRPLKPMLSPSCFDSSHVRGRVRLLITKIVEHMQRNNSTGPDDHHGMDHDATTYLKPRATRT